MSLREKVAVADCGHCDYNVPYSVRKKFVVVTFWRAYPLLNFILFDLYFYIFLTIKFINVFFSIEKENILHTFIYLFYVKIKNIFNIYISNILSMIPKTIQTTDKVTVRILKGSSFWMAFKANEVVGSIPASSLILFFLNSFFVFFFFWN